MYPDGPLGDWDKQTAQLKRPSQDNLIYVEWDAGEEDKGINGCWEVGARFYDDGPHQVQRGDNLEEMLAWAVGIATGRAGEF